MRKIFLLIVTITYNFGLIAQNSFETNPNGTNGIISSKGFGTTIHSYGGKASIYGTTGNTTTTSVVSSIIGFTNNSSYTNNGVVGVVNGTSNFGYGVSGYSIGINSQSSIGVYGYSDVKNGSGVGVNGESYLNSIASDNGYGGLFSSNTTANVNSSANSYGVYAASQGLGSVDQRFGLFTTTSGTAAINSFGLKASSDNTGNGATYGGHFEAKGSGTGIKYGIYATTSGSGTRYAAILDGVVGIGTFTPNKAGLVVNKLVGNTAAIFGDNTSGVGIDNNWPGVSLNGYYSGSRKPIVNGYVGGISFDPTTGKLLLYNTATSGTADNTIVGVDRVFIDNQGDVGIGVSDPLATLQVARGTGANGTAAFEGTTNSSHFNYSTTEDTYIRGGKATSKVYINDTGGNVAVGNINPTEKLHVAGNIKASGSVQATSANISNLTVSSSASFSGSTTFNNSISATDGFFSGSLGVGGTLSPDALNIGGLGSVITKIKRTTLTGQQIFGVVNNTCDLNYYNLPGVLVGDNVILNIDSPFSTLAVSNVRVSAADQVEVKFCNMGNSNTVLLTGLTFRFMYYR